MQTLGITMRAILNGDVLVAVLATLCTIAAPTAHADEVRMKFQLQNCPTPMTITLPAIFADARDLLSWITQNDTRSAIGDEGVVALAVSPRRDSEEVLVAVGDPHFLSTSQGRVTPAQFEMLKSKLMTTDSPPSVAPINKEMAPEGVIYEPLQFLSRFGADRSVTVIGRMDGTEAGADFSYYMGNVHTYASNCIAVTTVFSPTYSMSAGEFEDMMRSISIE